jgi:hypothetical protein
MGQPAFCIAATKASSLGAATAIAVPAVSAATTAAPAAQIEARVRKLFTIMVFLSPGGFRRLPKLVGAVAAGSFVFFRQRQQSSSDFGGMPIGQSAGPVGIFECVDPRGGCCVGSA